MFWYVFRWNSETCCRHCSKHRKCRVICDNSTSKSLVPNRKFQRNIWRSRTFHQRHLLRINHSIHLRLFQLCCRYCHCLYAFSYTGKCEGSITKSARGINGFGYDPIFLIKNSDKTMAELSEHEKNKISHRSIALNEVIKYIKNLELT